eukprot:scaffold55113_cov14-Tisochrysis_lutea.AAC.1
MSFGAHYRAWKQCVQLDFVRFFTKAIASEGYGAVYRPHTGAVRLPCCYTATATLLQATCLCTCTSQIINSRVNRMIAPAGICQEPKKK